jgi:hypothetical protein
MFGAMLTMCIHREVDSPNIVTPECRWPWSCYAKFMKQHMHPNKLCSSLNDLLIFSRILDVGAQ